MANESAVENISDLQTAVTCPGCGKELNLLTEHLRLTISPVRNVIEIVDAALVGAETDEEGNIVALAVDVSDPAISRDRFYMGTKFGAGEMAHIHNYTCLVTLAEARTGDENFQSGETVTFSLLTEDPDAAKREEGL